MDNDIEERIKKLERQVERLTNRRVYQSDIIPDTIKMRHIGEGVRYIRSGLSTGRPTAGEVPQQGVAIYFETDTNKIYIYNSVSLAWKSTSALT